MFNGDNPPGDPFVDEKAREEIRLKLEQSLSDLNAQIMKLRSKYEEMTAKSKEYFEEVVEALISGDEGRASIYAEEIAEIKRLASILVKTQLVLEQVKLRLETILEISELMGLVVPLLSLITEVGDEVAGIAPDAAKNLHELATYIEDFSNVSSVNELKVDAPEELDEEARKILEEAQKTAAERVKQSFPDVPKLSEEEKLVYSYVSKTDSELDLKKCAEELGIDAKHVKEILGKLEEKGLIELVG
ncbi:MAG: hypothetical protein DRN65_00835 [Thaumarchaeota archaeon]|nr:MAG: hypothetical protein DRN47_07135 [Candidatus Wolframiiraptor sp.]RLG08711.1 MAG: hypothetical protein DRN65_00835 [Nitrososphaerota archaeon]